MTNEEEDNEYHDCWHKFVHHQCRCKINCHHYEDDGPCKGEED